MSYEQECPRCGRVFHTRNDVPRVTCNECGTSWNTSDASSDHGCDAAIVKGCLCVLGGWLAIGCLLWVWQILCSPWVFIPLAAVAGLCLVLWISNSVRSRRGGPPLGPRSWAGVSVVPWVMGGMAGQSDGGGRGGARRVRSMLDGPALHAWPVGIFFGICAIGAVAYVAAGEGSR